MRLEKAIEILQEDMKRLKPEYDPNLMAAMWLGIEAGKLITSHRNGVYMDPRKLLPGETKE